MLNSEAHKELIDSYLRGTLSTEESELLEKNANSDIRLKNELDLQKSIIEALRANRKADLKARLNKINVNTSSSSNWWKYLTGATLISTIGIWLYLQNRVEDITSKSQTVFSGAPSVQKQMETLSAEPQISKSDNHHLAIVENTAKETLAEKKVIKRAKNSTNIETEPSLPNINTIQDNTPEPLNKDITAPEGDLTKSVQFNNSLNNIEVIKSKQHKFHYRYFDKKLYLYGNFDSRMYDILELNTSKGQAFYLMFENNYYTLEPHKTEISKLEIVKDKNKILVITQNINKIYKQIKKNEYSPGTDYLYQNTKTKEVREVLQGMNDLHEYYGDESEPENGWQRIYTVPTASIDTKQDPFSTNQFLDVTKSKKGTYCEN